jgi:hypothetical protein
MWNRRWSANSCNRDEAGDVHDQTCRRPHRATAVFFRNLPDCLRKTGSLSLISVLESVFDAVERGFTTCGVPSSDCKLGKVGSNVLS